MTRVKPFKLVQPGELASLFLKEYENNRSADMWYLAQPLTAANEKLCAWCNTQPVKGRRKYCSPDCQLSTHMHCYPQSNESKSFILMHLQACACVGCGLSFEELLVKKINRWWIEFNEPRGRWYKAGKIQLIGYFYITCQTGDIIQVDHITPLHKGGRGIGLENVQVLCVGCHKKKTTLERRK